MMMGYGNTFINCLLQSVPSVANVYQKNTKPTGCSKQHIKADKRRRGSEVEVDDDDDDGRLTTRPCSRSEFDDDTSFDEDDREGELEYDADDAERMGEVREKRTDELEAPVDEDDDGLLDVELVTALASVEEAIGIRRLWEEEIADLGRMLVKSTDSCSKEWMGYHQKKKIWFFEMSCAKTQSNSMKIYLKSN
jgi:hypothetical protein